LFVEISRKIAERKAKGEDVVSFGIGDPDLPTPPHIIERLCKEAHVPANHRYPESEGLPELRKTIADWYLRRFGVTLDPDKEVAPLIGSKEGIAHIALCLLNPGDIALITDPGYPVYTIGTKLVGGTPYYLPISTNNNFLPYLDNIPAEILQKARVLWLNYPNNPTGASASPEFFASVVEFAKQHRLVVIHDAAYAALVFEGKPLSFLATPGAIDVGIELHSMSKSFNMTGWRLGFVAGNPLLVRAYADVKDNTDSGQFLAIQEACAYALDHPEITGAVAAKYSRRMDGLVAVLNRRGLTAKKPRGSFFLYVKSPRGAIGKDGRRVTFERAENFSQWLITEKLISTVPWDDAGAYVRFSVTFSANDIPDERRVLSEIDRRLGDAGFES